MDVSKKEVEKMVDELGKNYNEIAEELEESGFKVERGTGMVGEAIAFLSDLQKSIKLMYALQEK
jgi:methyl-accepting chemotaxis protein